MSVDAELVAIEKEEDLRFRSATYDLTQAAVVGIFTGLGVSVFKLSIEAVRGLFFEREILVNYPWLIAVIPGIGGPRWSNSAFRKFPLGLRGTVSGSSRNCIRSRQGVYQSNRAKDNQGQFQTAAEDAP